MTPEIILVPVDAPPADIPVDPPTDPPAPSESSDSSVMLPDEPKRGRGRPPGAKNKAKPDVEPPTPRNAKARVIKKPTPIEADTEEEEEAPVPPPPPAPKRRKTVMLPRIQPPEVEPTSPRSQRRQIHVDAQARRVEHHTTRVAGYSTLLDTMLAY
jgi:hypothetical protein